jgi:hypothetical protein
LIIEFLECQPDLVCTGRRISPPKAALRHEPGAFDLNGACKSAAKNRGSQSDGDHHRC